MRIRTTTAFAWCAWLSSPALAGCPSDPGEPFFPPDVETAYREVRDCRRSGDHDLNYVRVLADPIAEPTYVARDAPFAAGSVIVKIEYADEECTDEVAFTAMRKEAAGTAPETGDWAWQKTDAEHRPIRAELERCIGCHELCGVPPDGHDWTCALP